MVDIPFRMQKLPRDKRGYPVPVIVKRDVDGTPLFTVNDAEVAAKTLLEDRCPLCGDKLLRGRWFIGGPLSAFHPAGEYFDAPMHAECKDYALKACPWLAAPKYMKRIDAAKAKGNLGILVDHTMIANRPDPFVAVLARGQTVRWPEDKYGTFHVKPVAPYINVEFWRHGAMIDKTEGWAACGLRMQEFMQGQEAEHHGEGRP